MVQFLPYDPSRALDAGNPGPTSKPNVELATAVNKLEFADTIFEDHKQLLRKTFTIRCKLPNGEDPN